MVDFLDLLVQYLCPTSSAASSCQSFISSHSSTMPPFGQYIYFLFFPTVFLLLFLWIIFGAVIKGNKAIDLLGTIAVFVFIIIEGFYPIFLVLGELWIVFIFVLGFLYVITRRFRKDSGKGGSMSISDGGISSGVAGMIGKKARSAWTGEERALEKTVQARMDTLRKAAHNLKHPPSGTDVARLQDSYNNALISAEASIEELKRFNRLDLGIAGKKTVFSTAKKYEEECTEISRSVGKRAA